MNVPMLKLHIKASGQKMNKNNSALTAVEQINLKLSDDQEDGDDAAANQNKMQTYSFEDLFKMKVEDT